MIIQWTNGSASTKKDGKLVSEIRHYAKQLPATLRIPPDSSFFFLNDVTLTSYNIPSWLLNHILVNFFLCFYLRESYFTGVFSSCLKIFTHKIIIFTSLCYYSMYPIYPRCKILFMDKKITMINYHQLMRKIEMRGVWNRNGNENER